MKTHFIGIQELVGSKKFRAEVIIDVENGTETISRNIVDSGISSSIEALTVTSPLVTSVADYEFTVVVEDGGIISTMTGMLTELPDLSTSGIMEEDTIFKTSNVTTISSNQNSLSSNEILMTDDNEVTVRSNDIITSSLGNSFFEGDISNTTSTLTGKIAFDSGIATALDYSNMLTASKVLKGQSIDHALIDTSTELSSFTELRSSVFNNFDSLRGFDSVCRIGSMEFTYGELKKLCGELPRVATDSQSIVDTVNISKEMGIVSSSILKSLDFFKTITVAVDVLNGKTSIGGNIVYAPGVNRNAHSINALDPTQELFKSVKELSMLSYNQGIPGYMIAGVIKGNGVIKVNISTDFGTNEYTLRDNRSLYSSLIMKDGSTLNEASELNSNILRNIKG